MVKEKRFYTVSYILLALISVLMLVVSLPRLKGNLNEFVGSEIIYFILVIIPLVVIGDIASIKINSRQISKKEKLSSIIAIWVAIILIFIFIIFTANHKSGDYNIYLSQWTSYYRSHSINDSLYSIVDVSNYAPAYNYILILISRLPMYDLHLIKYVSFLFSILLAFMMCKIIAKIKKSDFNYALFVAFLLLPFILIEYSSWGQCDAIYTSLAITAFYFALCKKSKLAFLFLGLSFIFKLQFLFIVPIMFILLIIKDEEGNHYLKWKDIWIPFAVYLINCIPVLVGRNLLDLLLVYVSQSGGDSRLSGDCANICLIYYKYLHIESPTTAYYILLCSHIAITFAFLIFYLVLVFKNNKKKTFTLNDIIFWAFAFSFTMVFLMPKMLDRFYFIPACLSIIYMFAVGDRHSCILGNITNLFFSITLVFVSSSYILRETMYVVMLIFAIIDFIYLLFVIFSKYAKVLKKTNKKPT